MSLLTLDQPLSPPLLPPFRRREEEAGEAVAARVAAAADLSVKPRPLDLYEEGEGGGNMMIQPTAAHPPPPPPLPPPPPTSQQQQMGILGESSGEDHEVRPPKKRAETWAQEETRCLVGFRREVDGLFNTSKSNKHLWEQISAKMRDKGFDRSPTMCTDKWRNLLKEFKKAARHRDKGGGGGTGKMSCYRELDELLKERNKGGAVAEAAAEYKSPPPPPTSKIDSYLQFSDKGIEDGGISFGSVEANGRSVLNLERHSDHEGHPLAITAADAVAANGVPPWNWRDTGADGGDSNASYSGRVILVKWGDYTRRIGIDGTADAIKDAIKSAFGLRTRRAFWLEDEDEVVRSLDRDMPLGTYILHLDEGLTIKVCLYDETERISLHTEEKTLYTEDDFHDFLSRRGWTALRELGSFRNIDSLEELRPGGMYQGVVRLLGD